MAAVSGKSKHEPIFVWELDGVILDWNQGSEGLYGFTKSEALGRVSHDLLKTAFPTSLEKHLEILRRDSYWSGELVHLTKDGRTVVVESWQQLIKQSNGQSLVLETNRDITARRKAEEALTQQKELLQVTLSSIGDAVIATDVDGKITFLNSIAQSITGWDSEAVGRPVHDEQGDKEGVLASDNISDTTKEQCSKRADHKTNGKGGEICDVSKCLVVGRIK